MQRRMPGPGFGLGESESALLTTPLFTAWSSAADGDVSEPRGRMFDPITVSHQLISGLRI